MGYTTSFRGSVKTNKPVDDETFNLINGLATTRRMKRNLTGYGVEGEFYYNPDSKEMGQEDTPDIIDDNKPPRTQPSLWLQWVMCDDKQTIEWDGNEKFYEYTRWMRYIINSILEPRGYVVNGKIDWNGEEAGDYGVLVVKNNTVSVK